MVSIREIAKQCFDEGEKRSATMKDMDEGINGMQSLLDTRCKRMFRPVRGVLPARQCDCRHGGAADRARG